ncbi:MAG: HAMP domain-containing sensor histidine kinase [Sphaerobacter sp.]|nr:HAMP domain-containing sensor histidine kinase [Sphaerobacter sp.]
MRTPLTGLRGNVQLALMATRKHDYTRVPSRLEAALRLIDTMTGTVQNLQDMSLLERGNLAPAPVLTDLVSTLRRAAARAVPSAGHTLELDPPEPIVCALDPQQLEQVWYHLLVNALTYSFNGGNIQVRLSRTADTATVTITDHGIGIPHPGGRVRPELRTVLPRRAWPPSAGTRAGRRPDDLPRHGRAPRRHDRGRVSRQDRHDRHGAPADPSDPADRRLDAPARP